MYVCQNFGIHDIRGQIPFGEVWVVPLLATKQLMMSASVR